MTSTTASDTTIVYIGTYTKEPTASQTSNGIYIYRLDHDTGALQELGTVPGLVNASFLTIDAQHRHLYTVQEVAEYEGKVGGMISAFRIDAQTGALTLINQQRTHGASPCYVSIDHSGKWLFVSNYTSGTICALPITDNSGLGEAATVIQHHGSSVNPSRQQEPHAHSIQPSPDNRFVLAADLGIDQILVYQLDAATGLSQQSQPAALHPGAGPRHLAFNARGTVLYCMNELDSTVTVFAYDAANGTLQTLQTVSALPDDFTGVSTGADIHIDPAGHYVYSSNRGHDSIAIFAIDDASGQLRSTGHALTTGRTPRNFAIDPTGTFLFAANQDSDTVVTFRIDRATGGLTLAGPVTMVSRPVCICISAPLQRT